jgi:Holin of 3TMs, for gene-transfer release
MAFDLNPFSPLIEMGMKIIDKVIPDPQAKATAQLEMLRLQQAGEFKEFEGQLAIALGQIEVNKVEAGSESLFKSGWRPYIGWVCGGGLTYQFLFRSLFGWAAENLWHWSLPPPLEMETLLTLLFGLLGLAAYRTVEKVRGAAPR